MRKSISVKTVILSLIIAMIMLISAPLAVLAEEQKEDVDDIDNNLYSDEEIFGEEWNLPLQEDAWVSLDALNESENTQAENFVKKAMGEISYKEEVDGTTKYGQWYGLPKAEWCAMFVAWCANQAGISEQIIKKTASTVSLKQDFEGKNQWKNKNEYTPKTGDIIFFKYPGSSNPVSHVGIVVSCDADRVYTVEGNYMDSVARANYALSDELIIGYGSPAYEEKEMETVPELVYRGYNIGSGWSKWVKGGQTGGTIGKGLEAMQISIENTGLSGTLTYNTRTSDDQWNGWSGSGVVHGNTGSGKVVDALQMKLTGQLGDKFDIYYRIYAGKYAGWQKWEKNGTLAETPAWNRKVEAFQIQILKKGEAAPIDEEPAEIIPDIVYHGYNTGLGWSKWTAAGETGGTIGKSLEALQVSVDYVGLTGTVKYCTQNAGGTWSAWSGSGVVHGNPGNGESIKGLQMELTGQMGDNYDIYYRLYAGKYAGWQKWAKNGETANTSELNCKAEAFQIKLIKKGGTAPEDAAPSEVVPGVTYHGYNKSSGWSKWVSEGENGGAAGSNLEAMQICIENIGLTGTLRYCTQGSDDAWSNWSGSGVVHGNIGSGKVLTSLKMELTGQLGQIFDIYYRVYSGKAAGWQKWAKNGESAEAPSESKKIEAFQIRIVKKGEEGPKDPASLVKIPGLAYHAYGNGWTEWVQTGSIMGTVGEGRILEAIQMSIENGGYTGTINYRVQNSGEEWSSWSGSGIVTGSAGSGKAIENLEIRLTAELGEVFDIYYRVYAGKKAGWQAWVKNGATAGVSENGLGVEAIQIRIERKGEKLEPEIKYHSCMQEGKWGTWVSDGQVSGEPGGKNFTEAVQMSLENSGLSGTIKYRVYIKDQGWAAWSSSGIINGAVSSGKPIEGIQVILTGQLEELYDVYYRVNIGNIGWLDWASNGETAGAVGTSAGQKEFQVIIISKGGKAPGSVSKPSISLPSINYHSYVQDYGWRGWVAGNQISGAIGENRRTEAIQISIENTGMTGTIQYRMSMQDSGWTNWVGSGYVSGLAGAGKYAEALQIRLTGQLAQYYDIYYRVNTEGNEWSGWGKNGGSVGSSGLALRIEAVQIRIVGKGAAAPTEGGTVYRTYTGPGYYIIAGKSYYYIQEGVRRTGNGWIRENGNRYYMVNGGYVTGWQYIDGLKYFFNNDGSLCQNVDSIIGPQSSYVLKLNKQMNCLTIYASDGANGYIIPVKSMLTSTGDDTPLGTFYTPVKYRWRKMVTGAYAQYATRLTEGQGFLFHSITYDRMDSYTLQTIGYNMLGINKSLGCIRLVCGDAYWIYVRCPLGTKVIVYNDGNAPGPFDRPAVVPIPADQRWDPTDPNL